MTRATPQAAAVAIFGDLEADLWGVVIGGEQPRAAIAGVTTADVTFEPADLDLDDGEVWTLTGNGLALRVERAAATTASSGERSIEPCRVSGSATAEGTERELDLGGVRSDSLAAAELDSLRLLGAWFPAGHEVALLSARPRRAKGQDHDAIELIARGEEQELAVEPRLSTTYDGDGRPRRVGVELWLGADEDEDQRPRRVAAVATGSFASTSFDGRSLSAYALQCASRGEPGAGVYVLVS
jgi:hypothetical protein